MATICAWCWILHGAPKTVSARSYILPASGKYGHRLVVELRDSQRSARVRKTAPEFKNARRDLIIAIDAGHGGEDPGAIGPRGLKEKDVALKIAIQLKRLLDKEPGYKGLLVRKGDYFVKLAERRKIARDKKADLFISIHADAFDKPSARGSSVFTLSQRGTSTDFAALVARENKADSIGGVLRITRHRAGRHRCAAGYGAHFKHAQQHESG